MQFYFDSRSKDCKRPFGAVQEGSRLDFNTYAQDGVFINGVVLTLTDDATGIATRYPLEYAGKSDENTSRFHVRINAPKAGLYWYKFEIFSEEGHIEYLNPRTKGQFQLTVYSEDYETPKRFKGGIIYHIFVDRFCKGNDAGVDTSTHSVYKNWDEPLTLKDADGVYRANDFYGGNFQGIIDKLPYLKSLGVTVIYLSPIFRSSSNHRYDTGNYLELDPLLGNEEKFKELIDKAKRKGIYIMLDGVFNHTGADSLYFNKFGTYDSLGAYQSKQSPYYKWYDFINYPDEYRCWWGVTVCPTVNKKAEGYRNLIFGKDGVIDKWSRLGVSAWRLDVVDELPEEFVQQIKIAVKSVSEKKLLIGEVWEDASNKISYSKRRHYLLGKELDGVMNYPFKDAVISLARGGRPRAFVEAVNTITENYPKKSLDCTMTLVGSHDTVRVLNRLSDYNIKGLDKFGRAQVVLEGDILATAKARLKIASTLQFFLPGIPSIYYGDESGMQGYEDPLCRRPMNWNNQDTEILGHYKKLGELRKKFRSQVTGSTRLYESGGIVYLERRAKEKKVVVAVNTSGAAKALNIKTEIKDLLSGNVFNEGAKIANNTVLLFESAAKD